MISDFHHVALFVADLDRSLEFYCSKLGFEVIRREDDRRGPFLDEICGLSGVVIRLVVVSGGGEIIELIEPISPASLPTDANADAFGIARLGFEVHDIDVSVAELRDRGVEFLSDVVEVTSGHYSGGKAVFFRDPDGIILELQQPPA